MDVPAVAPVPDGSEHARGRVVVGVDGSPGSRAALAHALAEAARRGADLLVVWACPLTLPWGGGPPLVVPDVDDVLQDTRHRAEDVLEDVRSDPALAGVPGADAVRGQVIAVNSSAVPALLDRSTDAELLVVGSRGRGAVRSALLGSVALHCVTHAACPVVVVHAPPQELPRGARVVVGVDGSAASLTACRAAAREAVRLGTDVEVVAAYSLTDYYTDLATVAVPAPAQMRGWVSDRAEGVAEQVRTEAAAEWGERAPALRVLPVEGAARDVLVERTRDAALLVVGSQGRGEVRGLLLGSVALHCAMHAICPVMVVHPPEEPGEDQPASREPELARS